MTLNELQQGWIDTETYHKDIHERFVEMVNSDLALDEHRTYVDSKVWGFGERSFWWAWNILLEQLPENPKLIEIGTFKGATISVWKLLRPDAQVFGVTPLDDSGLDWNHPDGYYEECIKTIHNDFNLEQPTIIKGKSNEANVVKQAFGEYNIVYVDGDHSYDGCLFDLTCYSEMVKVGGFLVIDDCCCDFHEPFGYFQGIADVQQAFDDWSKTTDSFEFVFNVKHLRILRRIK